MYKIDDIRNAIMSAVDDGDVNTFSYNGKTIYVNFNDLMECLTFSDHNEDEDDEELESPPLFNSDEVIDFTEVIATLRITFPTRLTFVTYIRLDFFVSNEGTFPPLVSAQFKPKWLIVNKFMK